MAGGGVGGGGGGGRVGVGSRRLECEYQVELRIARCSSSA